MFSHLGGSTEEACCFLVILLVYLFLLFLCHLVVTFDRPGVQIIVHG